MDIIKSHVGVIITDKNNFYLEQKTEDYPVPEFRLTYTLFGGEIEGSETPINALERELHEELDDSVASNILKSSNISFSFENKWKNNKYHFIAYEAILLSDYLREISKFSIKEGKEGVLTARNKLYEIRLGPNAEKAMNKYLKLNGFKSLTLHWDNENE